MIIFQPEILASDSTRKRGPSGTKTEPRKRAPEIDTLNYNLYTGPKSGPHFVPRKWSRFWVSCVPILGPCAPIFVPRSAA